MNDRQQNRHAWRVDCGITRCSNCGLAQQEEKDNMPCPASQTDRIEQLEADLRENDTGLRLLVDIVWQHATESTAVPFHKTSDMLIAKYRAALAPEQDK